MLCSDLIESYLLGEQASNGLPVEMPKRMPNRLGAMSLDSFLLSPNSWMKLLYEEALKVFGLKKSELKLVQNSISLSEIFDNDRTYALNIYIEREIIKVRGADSVDGVTIRLMVFHSGLDYQDTFRVSRHDKGFSFDRLYDFLRIGFNPFGWMKWVKDQLVRAEREIGLPLDNKTISDSWADPDILKLHWQGVGMFISAQISIGSDLKLDLSDQSWFMNIKGQVFDAKSLDELLDYDDHDESDSNMFWFSNKEKNKLLVNELKKIFPKIKVKPGSLYFDIQTNKAKLTLILPREERGDNYALHGQITIVLNTRDEFEVNLSQDVYFVVNPFESMSEALSYLENLELSKEYFDGKPVGEVDHFSPQRRNPISVRLWPPQFNSTWMSDVMDMLKSFRGAVEDMLNF